MLHKLFCACFLENNLLLIFYTKYPSYYISKQIKKISRIKLLSECCLSFPLLFCVQAIYVVPSFSLSKSIETLNVNGKEV